MEALKRKNQEEAGIIDINDFDGVTDAKKAALLSLQTKKKGAVNKGVVGQYPFFAPD